MFISADMKRRRDRALAKVYAAIDEHGGTTLLSTGITADDARLARAVVDAGVRLLEPNHPALALARGLHGVQDMHAAENVRHEVTMEEVDRVVHGVRAVTGPDTFITVGIPGGFTELDPVDVTARDFAELARAGADALHTHKASIEDLQEWVSVAHDNGLVVDAYISHPSDRHPFGIPAATPAEVAEVARAMQGIGVDMIGLMTGMSYGGAAAGQIPAEISDRLAALVGAVDVPTLAEGGINLTNHGAFRGTGVNILVVGTSFDDVARAAVADTAGRYLGRRSSAPTAALATAQ
jgi:imidazole glycerol-phosphate synthase subunit HisF